MKRTPVLQNPVLVLAWMLLWPPALPEAWPNGSVKGLKARGNVTVDMDWKDGKVVRDRLTSPESREVKVRIQDATTTERTTGRTP